MAQFNYAKNNSVVNYDLLDDTYVKQAEQDCVPASTVQHNTMMAQNRSRRNKMKNFNCANMQRNITVRERLRNKLKYADDIKLKKQSTKRRRLNPATKGSAKRVGSKGRVQLP